MSGRSPSPVLAVGVRSAASIATAAGGLLVTIAALPWLRGEDPATTVLRVRFTARGTDPEAVEALREQLGLPEDPVVGIGHFLARLATGDLGESWVSGESVASVIGPAATRSLALGGASVAVMVIVALALLARPTWRAASGRGSVGHRTAPTTLALAALPEVVVALVVVLVGAVWWQWFPATGWGGADHLVLPALALGLPSGGLVSRVLASVADQTLAEPWVTTWRTNGVGRGPLVLSVARRMLAVGAPQIVVIVMTMTGASVAVEKVFAIRGLGTTSLDAALAQDLPVLQGCVLLLLGLGLTLMALALAASRLLLTTGGTGGPGPSVLPPAPRSRLGIAAAVVIAGTVGLGWPRDGRSTDLSARLLPPSWAHPLGTDAVGHDLLGRVSEATLRTVGLAVAITAIAVIIAALVALPASTARLGALDVLNTVPSTFIGLVVATVLGPGIVGACLAVLAVAWIPLAVHARVLVAGARSAAYVEAAQLAGGSATYVLRAHVLPSVAGPLLLHALARVPVVALGIAGLSFIGLGADPDTAELGALLVSGLGYLESSPWVVGSAAGALVLVAMAAGAVRTPGR